MSKARYLTISNGLQLVTTEGCGFLSASGLTLEEVVTEVGIWTASHQTHPRLEDAERWLERAGERLQAIQLVKSNDARQAERLALKKRLLREAHDFNWKRKVKFADLPQKDEELAEGIIEAMERAPLGDPEAEFALGIYIELIGPKDREEAAKWYRKAADKGHKEALSYLTKEFSSE